MLDLSKELTVFVIACEKSTNYTACLDSLSKQTISFKLEKIENEISLGEQRQKALDAFLLYGN